MSYVNAVLAIFSPYQIGTSFLIYFGINLLSSLFKDFSDKVQNAVSNWHKSKQLCLHESKSNQRAKNEEFMEKVNTCQGLLNLLENLNEIISPFVMVHFATCLSLSVFCSFIQLSILLSSFKINRVFQVSVKDNLFNNAIKDHIN